MKGYLVGESLAQQIKTTIARVDGMAASSGATAIPTRFEELGSNRPKVFRVCTATGSWPVDSSKSVTFYGVTAEPNTVSVLNKLVSLPAPRSTATSRIVNIAKDGTQWYLVSFQAATATAVFSRDTQTITVIDDAGTQSITFISAGGTSTITYATPGPSVSVVTNISAVLNTTDCSIAVNRTTTSIRTVGTSQTATTVSLSGTQTATVISSTRTATMTTGTYTATFISLEI